MIAFALIIVAWLGTGVYLLLHGHPFAGGFCVFVASCAAYSDNKKEKK